MKYLFLSILMIGVGICVVGCEDDDHADPPPDENIIEFNGRVNAVYSADSASCKCEDGSYRYLEGYIIISETKVRYDPQDSLPNDFKISGAAVTVRAEDLHKTSVLGQVIRIIEIELM